MFISLIGSILFSLIMMLYISLLFGAPLGEYAMGGMHKVLPKKSKPICAFSIFVQAAAILTLLMLGGIIDFGLSNRLIKILGYIFSIYLTLNIVMNFLSKSKKEKLLMAPLSIIIAFCFWFSVFLF